jgi:molybdate transport system substrate-binding protein
MKRYCKSAKTIALLTLAALASCAKSVPPAPAPPAAVDRPLIVSVATSARDLIDELAKEFTAATGIEVKVNAGPSNALAGQILAGAPADLFLSANRQWADEIENAGKSAASARLLTNQLVIVVPPGNPGEVREPKDLLSDKVEKIALAGEKVPAGMYAEQALSKLDLLPQLTVARKIVRGQDVRNTLSFVERGEAEAGIVYSTDVRIASGVTTAHEFDASLHDEIVYVLVLLKHESELPAAREFFEFLQSPLADDAYGRFGFTRVR